MKKRMISLVLALAMCLSLCTTVFADPGASIEEKNAPHCTLEDTPIVT